MDQLKDVNKNIGEVKNTIFSIQEEYKTISHLETTLAELRREATKHKQLKSAKENVKNILNVEDLARQANEFIESNKVLSAHKCLLDMEKCRNDILEELGTPSQNNTNIGDIKLVEEFFKQVREIQNLLHNHIFVTIKRMLEVSKTCPEQLVSALRIIEREEA
jgi:capsular polysaccharide biosynthesis protein